MEPTAWDVAVRTWGVRIVAKNGQLLLPRFVSPAHTTRILRILIRGEVKHLPNDLTNSCHRKWAGLWEENSRHRMACRCGGPVDIPGDDGMPGEAKM